MNRDEKKFPQQEAPEKNTDNAFVQVGRDGHAVFPKQANDIEESKGDQREAEERPKK